MNKLKEKVVLGGLLILMTISIGYSQAEKIQATIKPNPTDANCIDVYVKPNILVDGYPTAAAVSFSIPTQGNGNNPTINITYLLPQLRVVAGSSKEYLKNGRKYYDIVMSRSGDKTVVNWIGGQEYLFGTFCFVGGPSGATERILMQKTPDGPPGNSTIWWIQFSGNSHGDLTNKNEPFYEVTGVNYGDNGSPTKDDYAWVETIPEIPLPIELISFTAQAEEGDVVLDWSTIEERNASHFVVQRSKDGEEWESIGEVGAIGNSHYRRAYDYVDENPYSGYSYYRLKMVDIDNKWEPTEVRKVYIRPTRVSYAISPNPAQDVLHIGINGADLQARTTSVKVYNMSGEEVLEKDIDRQVSEIWINCSQLTAGTYIVKLYSGNAILYTQRVIKQ